MNPLNPESWTPWVRRLHPDWDEDDLAINPEEIFLYPATKDEALGANEPLPVTPRAATMRELREAVQHLAEKGTPCWPGHIPPLEVGEYIGVCRRSDWIAVVGNPTPDQI